jgi:hypothetical protein
VLHHCWQLLSLTSQTLLLLVLTAAVLPLQSPPAAAAAVVAAVVLEVTRLSTSIQAGVHTIRQHSTTQQEYCKHAAA